MGDELDAKVDVREMGPENVGSLEMSQEKFWMVSSCFTSVLLGPLNKVLLEKLTVAQVHK
jgi:hypothetical protein